MHLVDDDAAPGAQPEPAVVEENELDRFEKADVYMQLLQHLVPARNDGPSQPKNQSEASGKSQENTLAALAAILDEYQEQSYLLDPYLEQMVTPPITALQAHIRGSYVLDTDTVLCLSRLVYLYTKIRGYKAITNFFPHEVADLAPTLTFLEALSAQAAKAVKQENDNETYQQLASSWELRYVLLLWLSLVCMIPFDLHQFDVGHRADVAGTSQPTTILTANRIEHVGRTFLSSPGKERDAAAVMLGKLFQRRGVYEAQFEAFAAFCSATLVSRPSAFVATGILQALCEIVKTNDPAFVTGRLPCIQAVLDLYDDPDRRDLAGNGLVVKYQTKLTCRLGLKQLRPRKRRRFIRVRTLGQTASGIGSSTKTTDAESKHDDGEDEDDEDEDDVPELIDGYVSKLIDALQYKDTVVRYSAAKGLARLCERLPKHFIVQVTDAIVSLFHINIPDLYEGANDLNAVSESTWQGACMALAEQARRRLFAPDLDEKLVWIGKALLFDVRRGAHSVGANVRDAACYVVWALARAHDAEAIRPHALSLAQKLVAVATLDRDVLIRRAASAAFQECVGRLDLFPHGIDVIRITDFYAISVRRSAFLHCAVEVARFEEYGDFMVRHLLNVTIRHWDAAMRRLGAKAVAKIVGIETERAVSIVQELRKLCASKDSTVQHGALLSLAELGATCAAHNESHGQSYAEVCKLLLTTINDLATGRLKRNPPSQVLEASCRLVSSTFDLISHHTTSGDDQTASVSDSWSKVVDLSLQDPDETVHTAAAAAFRSASRVSWKSFTLGQQQSHALILGSFDYTRHSDRFEIVLDHLMALVDVGSVKKPASRYSTNVETRRNAYVAIVAAIVGIRGRGKEEVIRPSFFRTILASLLSGLQDYTTDQRGDVGSWIRLESLNGLSTLLSLFRPRSSLPNVGGYVTEEVYDRIVGATMKQTVERIDHVREVAGRCLVRIYREEGKEGKGGLRMKGREVVRNCLLDDNEGNTVDFKNATHLFPRAVKLLEIATYREEVILGLLTSVGSKSDLSQRTILSSLLSYLSKGKEGQSYDAYQLFNDGSGLLRCNFTKNDIVLPLLEILKGMVEGGSIDELVEEEGEKWHEILTTLVLQTLRSFARFKSHVRIQTTILFVLSLLPISLLLPRRTLTVCIVEKLKIFLTLPYPSIRARSAEYLYVLLTVHDIAQSQEEVEVLEGTRWSLSSVSTCSIAADKVVQELERILLSDVEL